MEQKICFAVVYLAEALIAWQFCESIFSPRRNMWIRSFAYALGYGGSFIVFNMNLLGSNLFTFTVCNVLLILFCYQIPLSKGVFYGAVMSGLMLGTEIISMLLLWEIYRDFDLYKTHFAGLVLLSSLSKILYFVGTRICLVLAKGKESGMKSPSSAWVLLSLASVASMVVILGLIHIGLSVPGLTWSMEIWMSMSALVLLLANLAIFAAYQRMQQIIGKYTELLLLRQKEEADEEYYTTLKEQYESQRILIHDVRHHLCVIKELAENQPRKAIIDYVTEMERLPELQRRIRYAGDPVLNAVVVRYGDLCMQKGIAFSADIRNESLAFMSSLDITALFGNLLENAVEAADGAENAFVELTLDYRQPPGILVVTLQNSCRTAPMLDEEGTLRSRKKGKGHGLGMKSVNLLVKKYGGKLLWQWDDAQKYFTVMISLPLGSQ